jgi:hypothetical protein
MTEISSCKKIEFCIYCGEQADTRDHVPPKCLFPKPRTDMGSANLRLHSKGAVMMGVLLSFIGGP